MSAASPMAPLRPLPRSLTRIAAAAKRGTPLGLPIATAPCMKMDAIGSTAHHLPTIILPCRALVVCEMDCCTLVAQPEHRAHGEMSDERWRHSPA